MQMKLSAKMAAEDGLEFTLLRYVAKKAKKERANLRTRPRGAERLFPFVGRIGRCWANRSGHTAAIRAETVVAHLFAGRAPGSPDHPVAGQLSAPAEYPAR